MIYTTLNKIREQSPCSEGWAKLLRHLGKTTADDEPLALATILDSNGLDDALWCLRSLPEESRRWRKLAVAFARTVQHLMTDPRSLAALDVAERHADGLATDLELSAAWAAAGDAAGATAWAAARAATRAAAWAAWDAVRVACDATEAVGASWAARAAARDAASKRLEVIFRECLEAAEVALPKDAPQ